MRRRRAVATPCHPSLQPRVPPQPAAPPCPAVPPSLQLRVVAGLHLIDFEQLKIENQTLNEKIEERNEELLKLRKKTTTTVQVLTHLKANPDR